MEQRSAFAKVSKVENKGYLVVSDLGWRFVNQLGTACLQGLSCGDGLLEPMAGGPSNEALDSNRYPSLHPPSSSSLLPNTNRRD